ncbi:MAG: restriction endonuclease [candidate division WWE3 bacterium]|nr:restriction endonuclease [candidate division WWE3 bacterium]
MFNQFTSKYLAKLLSYGLTSMVLVIPVFIYFLLTSSLWLGVLSVGVFLFFVAYGTYKELVDKVSSETQIAIALLKQKLETSEAKESMWRQSLKERASGFPSLFKNISNYEKLMDDALSGYLTRKSHPAYSSSEIVKLEAKRRREAETSQRVTQSIIEYYENIAPFLLDYKEQEFDENEEIAAGYSEEESADPVTNFLTKDEYHKLSSAERNQMALDRFWKRPNKPKWLLGRLYERYVGYLYETAGYDVEYTGIFKGYEDLGRDLICAKGKEIVVIQCKNWSQFKTIFEKHIFQFFGTVFQYKDQNPNKKVTAVFYTTTEVSDLARRFGGELGIEIKEKFKMLNEYPCIKCNISKVDGAKIYHLPFDQQYDNTKIEKSKGEIYCQTVGEAESNGFRRAYRWHAAKETSAA